MDFNVSMKNDRAFIFFKNILKNIFLKNIEPSVKVAQNHTNELSPKTLADFKKEISFFNNHTNRYEPIYTPELHVLGVEGPLLKYFNKEEVGHLCETRLNQHGYFCPADTHINQLEVYGLRNVNSKGVLRI